MCQQYHRTASERNGGHLTGSGGLGVFKQHAKGHARKTTWRAVQALRNANGRPASFFCSGLKCIGHFTQIIIQKSVCG